MLNSKKEIKKSRNYEFQLGDAESRVRLAAKVYEKRKERGWNQTNLARETGKTQRIISNVESGDVDIRISTLKRLSDILCFTGRDFSHIFSTCFFWSLDGINSDTSEQEVSFLNKSKVSTAIVNN